MPASPGLVAAVELRHLRLPLLRPFRSALGEEQWREVLLVRVTTPAGEGWGECAAMGTPAYSSEYVAGARHVLRHHLAPLLLAAAPTRASGVAGVLAGVRGHRMAKAALEMAVLDAELRAAGISLARYLGATRERVEAGVAVGVHGSLPQLVDAVAAALAEGYRRVKLKIAPGWDVEPVGAVRERFGDDVVLQADANGAYRREDAGHLARLDPFALALIEQPLPPDDLEGHAELARRIATPVCLDESVTSAATAAHAVSVGAASVVNVKAGRVGGYLEAVRVHDVCRAAGVAAWCGGMFETGLARHANLALAALPGFVLPGDLSPPSRYLAADVVAPLVAEDGSLRVPDRPGIGADVLLDTVREHTVAVDRLSG
ncbi:MAG: o-succinylbenzoate synthase [Actinomycetota bacterium]|nr:o-succinylbenzoate synthase [Actinomycetota bacterium]